MKKEKKEHFEFKELFFPEEIAIIGATDREGTVGRTIMENLMDDFEGKVIPINPNREEVLGIPSYPDITSVSGEVDLAVIAVPPEIVNKCLENVGESGTKNVIVITAGFGEAGSEGVAREKKLKEIAEKFNLNLIGPNSLGIMSTPVNMNASFGPEKPLSGSISFMSQSGALITAVLSWACDRGIGFHNIVSLGNKAVLEEIDFLSAWGDDKDSNVIIAYLEGIENGDEFIPTARRVTKTTPIVMIKSGRTEDAAKAVSSHTGTLAGSEEAYRAALKQAGVIRANSIEELFDFAEVLRGQPVPDKDSIAIITNAGGPGIIATDALKNAGLTLASFSDNTLKKLGDYLPEEANIYNPIDLLGDANVDRYSEVADIVMEDPGVGGVIVISYPSAILSFDELAEEVVKISDSYDKPMVSCFMGGSQVKPALDILQEKNIPNYFDPERAVNSFGALNRYKSIKEREYQPPASFSVNRADALKILSQVEERRDNRLGVEAMDLLDIYGIPTPNGEIVEDPDQALKVAEEMGGNVVMKIVSPDILHKSDIGGVKVNVPVSEVRDEFEDLIVRARNYQPDANLLGVQVQEIVDRETGVETILGMNKDPQFGSVLMFGLGGIFVEVLEDVSFRVAPVSENEARKMINDLKSVPLLRGARGGEPVDIDKLTESIQRLSQLVTDIPAILELDINPLVVMPDGVKAVDLRLTVDEEKLET